MSHNSYTSIAFKKSENWIQVYTFLGRWFKIHYSRLIDIMRVNCALSLSKYVNIISSLTLWANASHFCSMCSHPTMHPWLRVRLMHVQQNHVLYETLNYTGNLFALSSLWSLVTAEKNIILHFWKVNSFILCMIINF